MRGGTAGVVVLALSLAGCGRSIRTEHDKGADPASGRFHLIAPTAQHLREARGEDYLETAPSNLVSDDGSVVVGYSSKYSVENGEVRDIDTQALRWTAATGTVALGTLPGTSAATFVGASAMNPSGSVIVGQAVFDTGARAIRWTEATGLVDISPPDAVESNASLVSDDGSVVAGSFFTEDDGGAFYWTEATGPVSLGPVPGGYGGFPFYLSPDGSVIAGIAALPCGNPCRDPSVIFRFTKESGMENLGTPPGYTSCSVAYVSNVSYTPMIAGRCFSEAGEEQPFLWSEALGLRGLGPAPPMTTADAMAVSRDGLTAVVRLQGLDPNINSAWRWTDADGLSEVTPPEGYDGLTFGITFRQSMSGDGSVAIGVTARGAVGTGLRWSVDEGAEALSPPPGDDRSVASTVTEDGNTVSGFSWVNADLSTNPDADTHAVLWRDGTVVLVSDLLEAQGDPPGPGVTLRDALFTIDGRALDGVASTPAGMRGWVATLAE